ncbi:MAG: endolytic transglycosylase MltG [Clostridia bacterium]|nr:endolytic transglycosylase MltG [Clostridia bacterium]
MSDNNKKRNITGSYPGANGANRPKRVNPAGSYPGKKPLQAESLKEEPSLEETIYWNTPLQKEEPVKKAENSSKKEETPKKGKTKLNTQFWKGLLEKYWKTLVYYSCILVASVVLAAWVCHIGNEVLGLIRPDKEYTVTIEENSSTMTIATALKEAGIIDHPYVFRLYCKLKKADGKFKFGEYTINSKKDYNQLISALKRSPANKTAVSFTIAAGDTQEDLVANLCDTLHYFEREELEDVLQNYDFSDYSFLKGLQKRNYRLEGYLYPGTYEMYEGESALAVVQRILDQFQTQVLTEENQKKIADSGYTLDQLITLASILQKEGGDALPQSAGVYFNRLKSTAFPYLESSATVQYILPAGSSVTASDIKTDDPYNTYRVQGLTPGPIANPGAEAIGAVFTPETTDAQYFAVQGDGKTLFAVTNTEHLKNIKLTGEGARGTGTIL